MTDIRLLEKIANELKNDYSLGDMGRITKFIRREKKEND